jgi:hypothetical protein
VGKRKSLEVQALVVTAGRHKGRICENDDDEELGEDQLFHSDVAEYDRLDLKWRKRSGEVRSIDCEIV